MQADIAGLEVQIIFGGFLIARGQPGLLRQVTRVSGCLSVPLPLLLDMFCQKVHQHPHLGRQVLAGGVDRVNADFCCTVLRQQFHQLA